MSCSKEEVLMNFNLKNVLITIILFFF